MIQTTNNWGNTTEAEIKSFENSNKISLPKDYRDFLLRTNGGDPKDLLYYRLNDKDTIDVDHFYGLGKAKSRARLGEERWQKVYPNWPKDMLPFAGCMTGDEFCISLGKEKGAIFFYSHEENKFYKQKNSFTDFIDSLEIEKVETKSEEAKSSKNNSAIFLDVLLLALILLAKFLLFSNYPFGNFALIALIPYILLVILIEKIFHVEPGKTFQFLIPAYWMNLGKKNQK